MVDASQDWTLVSGEEVTEFPGTEFEHTYTTLEFKRNFTSCDENDRDIKVCVNSLA